MSVLAILPLIVCALVIVVAKRSALSGASYGIISALLVIWVNDTLSLTISNTLAALLDSTILTLSAAIVIIPGLYFNAIIKSHGTVSAIQKWVEHLPYSREHKTLLLLFGLLPAVESLTGFGVSLFLSIPILFHLYSRPVAYRLAMLGMNIMPWGTLALATVVGATLSGISVHSLGWYTALTSSLVFPAISLVALYVVGNLDAVKNNISAAFGLSSGLSIALLLLTHLELTEISGVLAGILVCIIGAFLLPRDKKSMDLYSLRFFFPYGGVLLLIALTRLIPDIYSFLENALVLNGSTVSLKLLASPGISLMLVSIYLYLKQPVSLPHSVLLSRILTSCLSLFAFIALAQIMQQGGMIKNFSDALSTWNSNLLLLLSPIIGMVSGFITGSNLSGNAIAMTMQSSIGYTFDAATSFSAAQNSGAGHAVFTSIPIIVLILTLTKDLAPDTNSKSLGQESHLLSFGLKVSVFILLTLMLTTWLIYMLNS